MLLVIQSAMRLKSLSACFCFYATIHPSAITEQGRDGVENGDEEKSKEHRVEESERDWIESLPIYISSAHLGNLLEIMFCKFMTNLQSRENVAFHMRPESSLFQIHVVKEDTESCLCK